VGGEFTLRNHPQSLFLVPESQLTAPRRASLAPPQKPTSASSTASATAATTTIPSSPS
jgi:hypothetical protein